MFFRGEEKRKNIPIALSLWKDEKFLWECDSSTPLIVSEKMTIIIIIIIIIIISREMELRINSINRMIRYGEKVCIS